MTARLTHEERAVLRDLGRRDRPAYQLGRHALALRALLARGFVKRFDAAPRGLGYCGKARTIPSWGATTAGILALTEVTA